MLSAATEGVLQHRCAGKSCFVLLQSKASSLGGTTLRKWPEFQILRNQYPALSAVLDVVMDLLGSMCSSEPGKRPTLQALLQNPHLVKFSQKSQAYS